MSASLSMQGRGKVAQESLKRVLPHAASENYSSRSREFADKEAEPDRNREEMNWSENMSLQRRAQRAAMLFTLSAPRENKAERCARRLCISESRVRRP